MQKCSIEYGLPLAVGHADIGTVSFSGEALCILVSL